MTRVRECRGGPPAGHSCGPPARRPDFVELDSAMRATQVHLRYGAVGSRLPAPQMRCGPSPASFLGRLGCMAPPALCAISLPRLDFARASIGSWWSHPCRCQCLDAVPVSRRRDFARASIGSWWSHPCRCQCLDAVPVSRRRDFARASIGSWCNHPCR